WGGACRWVISFGSMGRSATAFVARLAPKFCTSSSCIGRRSFSMSATPCIESGRNPGLGCVADLRIDSWTKSWVPSPECILPLFVEYACSDLKQKMCSALAPPHLLAFYHPLADNLIDC